MTAPARLRQDDITRAQNSAGTAGNIANRFAAIFLAALAVAGCDEPKVGADGPYRLLLEAQECQFETLPDGTISVRVDPTGKPMCGSGR